MKVGKSFIKALVGTYTLAFKWLLLATLHKLLKIVRQIFASKSPCTRCLMVESFDSIANFGPTVSTPDRRFLNGGSRNPGVPPEVSKRSATSAMHF